jgi:hypothetical protein
MKRTTTDSAELVGSYSVAHCTLSSRIKGIEMLAQLALLASRRERPRLLGRKRRLLGRVVRRAATAQASAQIDARKVVSLSSGCSWRLHVVPWWVSHTTAQCSVLTTLCSALGACHHGGDLTFVSGVFQVSTWILCFTC